MPELLSCTSFELNNAFEHADNLLRTADEVYASGKIYIDLDSYFQRDMQALAEGNDVERAVVAEVFHDMAESENEYIRETAARLIFIYAEVRDREGYLRIAEQLGRDCCRIVRLCLTTGISMIERRNLADPADKPRLYRAYRAAYDSTKGCGNAPA
jgi:hypothetical protein